MRRPAMLLLALLLSAPGEPLTGTVVDAAGRPVADARVRLRSSATLVLTDRDGRFTLGDPAAAPGREITAARPGHIIGGATLKEGVFDYRIALPAIPAGDDTTYPWVTAFPEDDQAPRTDFGHEPCGACHRRILAFFSGASSPSIAHDNPGGSGACTSCHVPMEAAGPASADGVAREGVGCDLCHKISEVVPGDGRKMGVFAATLRRPPFGRQTVFGPFDDVPRGRDAFAPVFAESRFCAACHQSRSGNVAVYSEFEEWQASRYAGDGVTCQSCHMRGDGKAAAMSDLGPGRIERDPATLSSHRFHDSRSPDFLAGAVGLTVDARIDGTDLVVTVEVANRGAGHHLPAGSPMRHMLLSVAAELGGQPLTQVEGPTLPSWAGPDLAGRPGRAYAKLLKARTGDGLDPAPPWRDIVLAADTRISAGGQDRSTYRFRIEGSGPVRIDATLLIRRTFPAWADAHGLDTGEILVAHYSLPLRR